VVERAAIRVLGSIEVAGPSGSLALGLRQEVLLGVLAANAGNVVSTDLLIEAIWGDDITTPRSGALHTLVSRLRPQLPDGSLATQGAGYVLSADPAVLDVSRFEQLIANADQAPSAHALETLDEAIALWRGRSFGSVADRPGIQHRAVELDELHVVAAERQARLMIDVGRSVDAVPRLERLIDEHPFREAPVALVMEALARTGRQTDALRQFSMLRERLVEEAGLDPSANLRSVEEAVLTDQFVVSASSSADAAAAPTGFPIRLRAKQVERRPGERIAYATVGAGPSLVFMPGWISSLDAFADGTDPRGVLLEVLSREFSVTAFDRYGTGLSSATDVDFGLHASADEVRAVLGVVDGPSTLLAASAAGPAALVAAAKNPAVERIVLMCTYASGPALFTRPETKKNLVEAVEQSWGLGSRILADMIVPGIDAVTRSEFARFQRRTATSEVASGYVRELFEADASDALADIEQPCLVLHYRGDPAIPYEGARQLVLGIDNAELEPLEGPFHTPPPEHVEAIVSSIRRFVQG
jgi:DNA-binding SARP family transcriptional activator/pimeloyl-ACP methyl ester carboxylesterase